MTNSAATLQNGHIYVQLSNHYTATVRNVNDFKALLANENEDKSIMEIKEIWNVTAEFEAEIKEIIAEFKGEVKGSAPQPKKKVNKRTANKVNRLLEEMIDAMDKAYELETAADDYDNDMTSWERKDARKEVLNQNKIEEKKEKELSEYMISKDILNNDDLYDYLTEKNNERYCDLCCDFLDVFQTVWMHLEYA